MAYRRELFEAYAQGETETEGASTYEGTSYSESTSFGDNWLKNIEDFQELDPHQKSESESFGHVLGSAQGSTESHSTSTSETKGWHEGLAPVLGKEVSHIERRSLEEQLFRAMAVLFDQKERFFVARIGDRMSAPLAVKTPTVKEGSRSRERIERYLEKQRSCWPFFLPLVEAAKRVEARKQKLLAWQVAVDEPETVRRRIK